MIGRPKHIVRTQVPQILDLVGLTKKSDNFPTELSGGEQQRVSIARAFVNRPLILLADEPTGNLDPATTVGIMRLLDRINRTGTTVVMATHDQRIVDAMRRRVIELDHGSLVRDQVRGVYGVGPELTELMSRLAYFARETLISLRRNLLMTIAGIMTVAISLFLFGGILLVSRDGRPRHQQVEARHRARDLHEGRRRADTQIADGRGRSSKPNPQGEELPVPEPRRTRTTIFKKLFADQPALVEIDDARRPARRRSASRRSTPQLTERDRRRVHRTCPASTQSSPPAKQIKTLLTATQLDPAARSSRMAAVLLASSLFLIVNTIRLATFARRREIEVMKLVGASNWFVRVPFMAEGLVQGAIGAGFAFGLVYFLKWIITNLLKQPAQPAPDVLRELPRRVRASASWCWSSAPPSASIGSMIGLRRFLEA